MNTERNAMGIFIPGHNTSSEVRNKIALTLDKTGNLIGKKFGFWLALERRGIRGGQRQWLCRCDCGKEKEVSQRHLVNRNSTKCIKCTGRLKSERVYKDRFKDPNKIAYSSNRRCAWVENLRKFLFEKQNGICPVCNKHLPKETKKQCMDHNHKTGFVRALVHRGCNVWVGRVEQDPDLPERILNYLRKDGPWHLTT